MRQARTTVGFAAAGRNGAFRRHVAFRRDLSYATFMRQLPLAEDWAFWHLRDGETASCFITYLFALTRKLIDQLRGAWKFIGTMFCGRRGQLGVSGRPCHFYPLLLTKASIVCATTTGPP